MITNPTIVNANKLKPFRHIGILTLLVGLADILVYFANAETRRTGGRDVSWLFWSGVLTMILAVFVIRMVRWGIVLISVCYGVVGIWLIVGSARSVPFPWLLINLGFGLACFLPAALLIRAAVAQPPDGHNQKPTVPHKR